MRIITFYLRIKLSNLIAFRTSDDIQFETFSWAGVMIFAF